MAENKFKDKLMVGLADAVKEFNAGATPSEAVKTAAINNNFNLDQTKRLVETFNTARTIYHYDTNKMNKEASFELADPDKVIVGMFGDEAKKATVNMHDYSFYEKSASSELDDVLFTPVQEVGNTNLDTLGYRAYKQINMQRQFAKEASDMAGELDTLAQCTVDKIAMLLKTAHETDTTVYSRFASSLRDDEATLAYLPVINNRLPAYITKSAKFIDDAVIDDSGIADVLDIMRALPGIAKQAVEAMDKAASITAEANKYEQEFLQMAAPSMAKQADKDELADFFVQGRIKTAAKPNDDDSSANDFLSGDIPKPLSMDFADSALEGVSGAFNQKVVQPGLADVFTAEENEKNKEITARLKNVQRSALLEDLMINDPIISEHNPEAIARAYSAILNIAPEMATNKEVVRAVLRQSVESTAISPYDASQWATLEKTIKEITGRMPAQKRIEVGGKK